MLLTVETLQKLKDESHLSYREIAERSGVPIGTVQKVLGGITRSPRRDTLEALAAVLADPEISLSENRNGSHSDISYKAIIKNNASEGSSSRDEVHETEHSYAGPDHEGEQNNQIDDMVERLLDSKKSGEFTVDDYYVISEKYRIELIDGVIYDMAAPVFDHQHISGLIYYQLMDFKLKNNEICMPGIAPLDVQLDKNDKTMVQPDVIIFCDMKMNHNRVIYGAPDFVLEVFSPSTRSKDRIIKRDKYRNAGCREYWMVDPLNQRVKVLDFESNFDGVYTFDQKIPVRISGGRCVVDFSLIKKQLIEIGQL